MATKRTFKQGLSGWETVVIPKEHECGWWCDEHERFKSAGDPVWELAADVDCVFTEPDAFDPQKLKMGMGRIYRAWKRWRTAVDPDFDPKRWRSDEAESV